MRSNLGPLAALTGTWQGAKGRDDAPSDDRGTEVNAHREQFVLEPFGPVANHEQQLWGPRYATSAFRLGEADAFHEETGYWLRDASARQVMRAFIVPRGITVLTGGEVATDARAFRWSRNSARPSSASARARSSIASSRPCARNST